MDHNTILPFFMAYPYPYAYDDQMRKVQDLEYLQQLYPQEAKKIQMKVLMHIEPIDYNGSFLYDEYPDQLMMYRVAAGILNEMKRDAEKVGEDWRPEKELWMQDMIKLVLYMEIFKRRCKKNRI